MHGIKETREFQRRRWWSSSSSVVFFVIVVGAFYVNPENWKPFAPYGYGGLSFFGKPIWGQDAQRPGCGNARRAPRRSSSPISASTRSRPSPRRRKNPQRDVPIGIIASLIICTILYIVVAAVLTGMVPYDKINRDAPVSDAFAQVGLPWAQFLIAVGAITGITSVLLVMMLSQPRVLLAMARDGLLPPGFFAAIHHASGRPGNRRS